MSIDNKPNPPRRDDSDDSPDSTPERDQNPPPVTNDRDSHDAQQPKRKGGRKPVSWHSLPIRLSSFYPTPSEATQCRRRETRRRETYRADADMLS